MTIITRSTRLFLSQVSWLDSNSMGNVAANSTMDMAIKIHWMTAGARP